PELSDAKRRRSLFFLGLAVAGVGVTMALQRGLNANFLADDIKVSGLQIGILEGFRESCGVVAFAVLALLAGFAEPLVGAAMLLLLAAGLAAYTFVYDFAWVVILSLVWSQGLHVWMPLPNSMTLSLAEPGRAGLRLGQIAAAGSAGWGLGLGLALVLMSAGLTIRPMYLLAGAASVVAAGACLAMPRDLKTPGPRLVFRRKYGLYYLLCFLEGWRKQIFICFAGFLLVREYGASVQTMLILWIIAQVIGYFGSPHVGRLVDRVGERRVLIAYYTSIIFVFVGYAAVPNAYLLYFLFVSDSALFMLAMATTTYVNRIVPPAEHTPTLSMGVAMNHVAAVAMPLAGGFLWKYLGYQYAFGLGAVAAALSVVAATLVPRHGAGPPAAKSA
ncbi:MAG: MFS transporter, partial [Planctomycetota bacterium]|nr:MFS transporter [Planctomycetota bacterium]